MEDAIARLTPYINGRVDLIEFAGKKCLRDFYRWYRKTDVHLIVPPRLDEKAPSVSAPYFPVSVTRAVFREETEKIAREKARKWLRLREACKKNLCVHYEHMFFIPPKIGSKERNCVVTLFLSE